MRRALLLGVWIVLIGWQFAFVHSLETEAITLQKEMNLFKFEFTFDEERDGNLLILSIRGFVDVDGWLMKDETIKQAVRKPIDLNAEKKECLIRLRIRRGDEKLISVKELFSHLKIIYDLRDPKVNTVVMVSMPSK